MGGSFRNEPWDSCVPEFVGIRAAEDSPVTMTAPEKDLPEAERGRRWEAELASVPNHQPFPISIKSSWRLSPTSGDIMACLPHGQNVSGCYGNLAESKL